MKIAGILGFFGDISSVICDNRCNVAISRQYINPVLLPAAGTLSMSIKENYCSAVNHRLVTDLPLVISGWLKVDRRSTARIID